jgi:predicted HicB family RNase H-like nuclease
MNENMTYKGYTALVEFDAQDRIFWGRIAGITDIISFDGTTVDELETDFHRAVDFYLETSAKTGRPAQKPCSGKLTLRVPPDVHRRALVRAQAAGKSLNQWAAEVLAKAE